LLKHRSAIVLATINFT